MYMRLIILCVIILAALCGLGWLGYRAIEIRAQGLEGARLGEFAEVAEQIRQDVNRRLDEFIETEQQRPWTDYQYYYVPDNVVAGQQQMPWLRSPLGAGIDNGLAYGNFQIEPDSTIVTPYYQAGRSQQEQEDKVAQEVNAHLSNIRRNVLPALGSVSGAFGLALAEPPTSYKAKDSVSDTLWADARGLGEKQKRLEEQEQQLQSKAGRRKELTIETFQKGPRETQIINQPRSLVASNVAQNVELLSQQEPGQSTPQRVQREDSAEVNESRRQRQQVQSELAHTYLSELQDRVQPRAQPPMPGEPHQTETVQIRIEPLVPLVFPFDTAQGRPSKEAQQSLFGGQIFLLRHVQIEDRHLLQGFQLNESRLIEEIEESAHRYMREGMTFELVQTPPADEAKDTDDTVAYTAILDFGFGDMALNLKEIDPAWIAKQIRQIRSWYFSITAVVFLAVTLALGSLWLNARAQLKLAQKKDDFISAVSHELRTPLTSIRMYSEMLEKNWVKSKDKQTEYYQSMRQESERLSRLIDNVLDFSRIQKGRKKYTFRLGNVNECVAEVTDMMVPYAAEHGFSIERDLGELGQTAFDGDAVTQIVVNLLDNAIKYARRAEDKTITVRTRREGQFVVIEVEDHGPGVPHRQCKKVFEQFYRCGPEATRETAGTGLGLALVKKFAQAHNGFVEVLAARPTGAIFRVGLATQVQSQI